MGKKSKVGKQRKDHFYTLAKQQGFRARSAYKLTQLGNKFNLFDDVSFVIDLCAAPGGWMQVARQSVPMAGHVFGVDLFPIKPIKGCTAIQADITTLRCEKLLNEALDKIGVPNKKADLVLHDGAPNVGSSWDRDAYNQNDLVLKALNLATKFLKPKGTFVTKVFRSADYTKLLYVFEQLFGQVTPTKPSSSREVSAEIFVVCRNYKAPTKISSALFDVSKVFEQIEEAIPTAHGDAIDRSDLINKSLLPSAEKAQLRMGGLKAALLGVAKKNRGGYEPGDDFRKCTLRQFFESAMPAHVLVHHHRIEFSKDDPLDVAVFNDELTTDGIKECLADLKLVGKNDLKTLLKWRLAYLKKHAAENPSISASAEKASDTRSDIDKLQDLLQMEAKEKLKLLRKNRQQWKKTHEKMKVATAVFDGDTADCQIFVDPVIAAKAWEAEAEMTDNLQIADSSDEGQLASSDDEDTTDGSDDEDVDYTKKLEEELAELHKLRKETQALQTLKTEARAKTETRRRRMYQAWAEEMKDFVKSIDQRSGEAKLTELPDFDEEESDDGVPEELKKLPVEIPDQVSSDEAQQSDEDISEDSNAEIEAESADSSLGHESMDDGGSGGDDEDSELPTIPMSEKKQRQAKRKKETARKEKKAAIRTAREAKMLSVLGGNVAEEESTGKTQGQGVTRARVQTVAPNIVARPKNSDFSSDEENEPKAVYERPKSLDELAEIQAIGKQLSRKKSRMEIIDGMYNRFAFEDPAGLPDWFKEHDKKARTFETPMTKELAAEFRAKMKEISERPIRKVAEARARKRARGDKSQRNKRDKTYIAVSKRGGSKNFSARSGKKSGGHFTNVDRRLKKDKRGVKAAAGRKRKR